MSIIARLSALLTANTSGYESGLARANRSTNAWKGQTQSALAQAGRSFDTFNNHVQSSIGGIVDLKAQLGGIATAAASALSVQKIVQYSDAWKQMNSRLSLVTKDTKELAAVQNSLFQIANRNSTPVLDTADAYVRLANSTSDAQKQQYNLLEITDLLGKTLKISGTNAQGAAIFLQQFGQAASNDFKAIGQELQTFADQNPTFYKIIREEAQKTGMSLKDFAKEGGLSFGFVADALKRASDDINSDAGKIQKTVSQALIELDNAFLRFIGQSTTVADGTRILTYGILTLAQNFGTLAMAAGTVAAVFAGRVAGSLAASLIAWNANNASALAYQLTLARMAGVSAAAATAQLGLAAAVGALGRAMAFLGGPVGVAVIGTIGLLAAETRVAAVAQAEMNMRLEEHRGSVAEYIYADEERRKQIRESARSNVESMKIELQAQQRLFAAYQQKSGFGKFIQNLRLPGTEGNGVRAIVQRGAALENGISELEDILDRMDAADDLLANDILGGGGGSKKKDVYKDIIQNLREESQLLEAQINMYGEKDSAIARAQQSIKIQNQLTAAGINLTKQQQAEIEKYLDSIEKQTELQDIQTKQQKRLEEQERDRQQALNQLGTTFESAFEKAIVDGEELSDVLQSLLDDILRIITRVTITAPIGNAITDALSSSGDGEGGFLSGLFDWLPSFDVGTNNVPRDMIAQIHKGEMIVPAYDADKMRGGGMGGDVTVNIINNAGASVSASQSEGASGTELTVMIDQAVAENMNRPGSRTNQAMKAFQNKTLVRR